MATFGKKNQAAGHAVFGKRSASVPSAGVFGTPAHPKRDLSPEAKAFMEAERGMRAPEATPSAFPMPSGPSASVQNETGKPAGKPVFGRRIIARIVDELIILIPMVVILMPSFTGTIGALAEAEPGSAAEARANLDLLKIGVLIFLAQALYGVVMESSAMQATLGKMLVGAVVTNNNGKKPGLGAVIMRNTLGRLVVNLTPFCIGYLIGLARADRKGLHDMMASTTVRARGARQANYPEVFA